MQCRRDRAKVKLLVEAKDESRSGSHFVARRGEAKRGTDGALPMFRWSEQSGRKRKRVSGTLLVCAAYRTRARTRNCARSILWEFQVRAFISATLPNSIVDLFICDWRGFVHSWLTGETRDQLPFHHRRRIGRIQPWHFLQSHLPLDYYYIHLKRVIDKKRFRQNFRATRTSCNHPASNPGRHKLKKYHNINVIIILHLAILNVM